MTPPLTLAEAWSRLLGSAAPLLAEQVPTAQAAGRYLAVDLHARRTQPAADLSAMDGYAVSAATERGPWTVVGESAAGRPFLRALSAGEAVRISTGALLPPGQSLIMIQENARRDGDRVSLSGDGVPSSAHIRRIGFDFRIGDAVIEGGTQLGPGQIAAALSAGHGVLEVTCRPRVAVLDTGDELAADPAACAPHQIPASNGAMLAAMCEPWAASVARIGPVPDSRSALAHALETAGDVDVLVTSGGVSVGDHDLIRPALEAWGANIDFWRVAIKPGKPLLIARRGEQWILGLPGNPVSSYVTGFLFLLPLLRRLGGARGEAALPMHLHAQAATPLPATGDRREFLRARLERDGTLTVLSQQDSSALRALASANALIERSEHSPESQAGDRVPFYWLENGGIA